MGSSYFCELSLHTEFQRPSTYPFGRKVTTWKEEEREREKIMTRTMATCSKSLTARARANIILKSAHTFYQPGAMKEYDVFGAKTHALEYQLFNPFV